MTDTLEIPTFAETIRSCYETLQAQSSNVVLELMKNAPEVLSWSHYPKGDVKDLPHHSQYYYHSHPSKDEDRVQEHGHFHLFLKKTAFKPSVEPVLISEKHKKDPSKDATCHVAAIAMNAYGYPTALFTVNHWVTKGLWYSAEDIIAAMDQFAITKKGSFEITNRWITAMFHLFKPVLIELLRTRDAVIQEWQETHASTCAFSDKALEITSVYQFE